MAREKQIAQDAERKEAAKLRELEARFDEMQRRWQERGDETLARIAETAERRKAVDEAHRQTARVRREMREDWETIIPAKRASPSSANCKIEEGTRVRAEGHSRTGAGAPLLGDGRFEVEAGFMKMQVSAGDIEEVLPEHRRPDRRRSCRRTCAFKPGPELNPSVQEINVIGEHAEEAIERVERFLDAAVMATAARVRIVHGHGMGVLKRAVQESAEAKSACGEVLSGIAV